MINYINKGIELIEEIERQGYVLYNLDGVWVTNGNDEVVQSIIDNFVIPEPEPVANWDSFNGIMLSDPIYQQAVGTVLQIAPGLATALPAALSLVSTNGVGAFSLVWNSFCSVANIQQAQRDTWATLAETNNLPQEFIDSLRG